MEIKCIKCHSRKYVHFRESMEYICDKCINAPYKIKDNKLIKQGKREILSKEKMEKEMTTSKERTIAGQIILEFEEVLEKNNISIPDEEREGAEEEARIYGSTYYNLEDKITRIIKGALK